MSRAVIPPGRSLILELDRGTANSLGCLTPYQRDAAEGLYAAAMAGYLRWLAPRYNNLQAELPRRVMELRSQAYRESAHPRTRKLSLTSRTARKCFWGCRGGGNHLADGT